jgi:hypothetical protein
VHVTKIYKNGSISAANYVNKGYSYRSNDKVSIITTNNFEIEERAILVLDNVSAAHNGQILNDSSSNKVEAIDLPALVTKMCIWKGGSSCEWPHYPELSGGFYDMSRTCISGSWMTSDNKYMQS